MKRPPGRPRIFTADQLRQRRNARRNAWRERKRQLRSHLGSERSAALKRAGLSIVTAASLTRPPLLYIDGAGRLWREDLRSAEQLIADWQRENRKKGHHAKTEQA